MDNEGALGILRTGKKTLEQIVDDEKYLQWNGRNRVQIMWNLIQKSEEKNKNIIFVQSYSASYGNQREKEEARLRDFHIGYW